MSYKYVQKKSTFFGLDSFKTSKNEILVYI